MTTNSLLFLATLAIAGQANGKPCTVWLSAPVIAGHVILCPGEYSLKVLDDHAIFTNVENGKVFSFPLHTAAAAPPHPRRLKLHYGRPTRFER